MRELRDYAFRMRAALAYFEGRDACIGPLPTVLGWGWGISEHGYSYSMGVGDAWSVKVLQSSTMGDGSIWYETQCKSGNAYNYGIGEAHYPVPATMFNAMVAAGDIMCLDAMVSHAKELVSM